MVVGIFALFLALRLRTIFVLLYLSLEKKKRSELRTVKNNFFPSAKMHGGKSTHKL